MAEVVAVTCVECGEVMPSGLLVCGECGVPFAPSRFTPPSPEEPAVVNQTMLDLGLGDTESGPEVLPIRPPLAELTTEGQRHPVTVSMTQGREVALIVAGSVAYLVVWGCAGMVFFGSLRLAGVL